MPLPVLGWGLTTGQITLSHYGSRSADLALVGDCINLAFRLSSMASKTVREPIVICRQTAMLVTNKLPLMDLGDQKIRGRTGMEHLFAVRLACEAPVSWGAERLDASKPEYPLSPSVTDALPAGDHPPADVRHYNPGSGERNSIAAPSVNLAAHDPSLIIPLKSDRHGCSQD